MLLFDNPASGNCYKVRLLLAQLAIPYERRTLSVTDRSNRAEVLGGLNPALRVPTLVLDDGRPLGESNAILWFLGDGTAYVPGDRYERAQVLQWQFFEQYDHEPNVAVARFWMSYRRDKIDPAFLAERHKGGYRAFDAMERHLAGRQFLVGERYSLADISLYAYTHVAGEGGFDLERYPAIRAWLSRIAAQPRHIPITA
jgi:glutathione S-transferase